MRKRTLVAALFGFTSVLLSADPFAGTWKPNVSKWKLSPGAPERRKLEIITIEVIDKDRYRQTITTTDGSVSANPGPVVWQVEGKDMAGSLTLTRKG